MATPDLTDLKARCAEVLSWQNTGILTGDALRSYAARTWPNEQANGLYLAERATLNDAARVLLGMEPKG